MQTRLIRKKRSISSEERFGNKTSRLLTRAGSQRAKDSQYLFTFIHVINQTYKEIIK